MALEYERDKNCASCPARVEKRVAEGRQPLHYEASEKYRYCPLKELSARIDNGDVANLVELKATVDQAEDLGFLTFGKTTEDTEGQRVWGAHIKVECLSPEASKFRLSPEGILVVREFGDGALDFVENQRREVAEGVRRMNRVTIDYSEDTNMREIRRPRR